MTITTKLIDHMSDNNEYTVCMFRVAKPDCWAVGSKNLNRFEDDIIGLRLTREVKTANGKSLEVIRIILPTDVKVSVDLLFLQKED